ncbi:MAG: hypothetical protein C0424_01240 [Sphingobacteriaceae bacterium]|nr:hypothetical protein [Sphingobacteriaceae bacterium]
MKAAAFPNTRALWLLILANTISGAAQGISLIAIPWYFIDQLHEPVLFTRFYAAITLVSMVWVIYAGSLIDRFKRKHIFMGLTAVCGLVVLATALFGFASGPLGVVPTLLVMSVTLLNFNLHYPSLYAFAQELADKTRYARIVSYLEIQGQATNVLAGAMAALLLGGIEANKGFYLLGVEVALPFSIKAWEMHEIFLLDALTYVVAFGLIAFIRYVPQTHYQPETGNALLRIRQGFDFLKKRPQLLWFGVFSYGVFVSVLVQDRILLPEYVRVQLQSAADVFASSDMLFALGALVSGVITRRLFGKMSPIAGVSILMIGLSVLYVSMAFNHSLRYLFIFSFIYGYVNTGVRILRVTYLFHTVPNHIIGRLLSFFKVADTAMRAAFIGVFTLPFFHEGTNIRFGYLVFGIFILLCGLAILPVVKSLTQKMNESDAH